MGYDYDKMIRDAKAIAERYDTAFFFKIGESYLKRDIICMRIGHGRKKLIALGAFHGLEYITALFLISFASRYCNSITNERRFFKRDAALLSKNVSLYIVPMVNPDGVNIAVNGIDTSNKYHNMLGAHDFKRVWQANARGVDINHNFDADWDSILDAPAPSKYGGEYPNSEKETRAVTGFVRRELFDMLLAFHSQGEEIYYDFNGFTAARSAVIADRMEKESGYKVSVPEGTASFGGCKDWFIKEFGREGFTVEMGKGKNPLPVSDLDNVFEPCARIILCAMEEILK